MGPRLSVVRPSRRGVPGAIAPGEMEGLMNWIRRWQRVVGGLAAALLLVPVPAMAALTFNGSWSVVQNTQSGGPTPPAAGFTDTTNNAKQQDDLSIDIGNYQGVTATASSTIELTRSITLSSSNQLLEFEQDFKNQLKQAGVSVTVTVKQGSTVVQTPLNFSASTRSSSFVSFSVNQSNINNRLASGNYTLDVKVSYNTNNKLGGWKAASAHHLDFEGL
jgi:hypothetical protein